MVFLLLVGRLLLAEMVMNALCCSIYVTCYVGFVCVVLCSSVISAIQFVL